MTTVLIDNGHGANTPGKRSPDGLLREWEWTRQAAAILETMLKAQGIPACRIVPEDIDIPLAARVERANAFPADKILVSLHLNAAQSGSQWTPASGWEAYVAPGACERSRMLASLLADEAQAAGLKVRRERAAAPYKTRGFALLRGTRCPAVLTENLFMDNLADCRYLLTAEGMQAIAALHAGAIKRLLQ